MASDSKFKVSIFIWITAILLIYNYANIFSTNRFVHPDDHATWVFSRHLYDIGILSIDEPLNKLIEYPAIRPLHSLYVHDKIAVSYTHLTLPTKA